VVPIAYNTDPALPGRGSAIFLHVARPDFECERRGEIEIKGVGPLETWFLIGRRSECAA